MIPSYLANISTTIENNGCMSKIRLCCHCGCDEFSIYIKKKDAAFLLLEREYTKDFISKYGKNYELQSDDKCNIYVVRRNIFGKIVRKDKFEKDKAPLFYNYVSAKCKRCGKEYVVYDQTQYGYDALTNKKIEKHEESQYDDKYAKIEVATFYDVDNVECKIFKDQSLAFGRIAVYSINNNKRKKIIDVECE